MARQGKFNKLASIKRTVAKYAARRKELKEAGDYAALSRLPKNSCPTRIFRLCELTGRPRAVYRKFGISRIMLRELALDGRIPGMKKASW